jgi:hypothetical protein
VLHGDKINKSRRSVVSYQADVESFLLQSHLDLPSLGEGNIEEQHLVRARTLAPRRDRASLCNLLGRRRRNTP